MEVGQGGGHVMDDGAVLQHAWDVQDRGIAAWAAHFS